MLPGQQKVMPDIEGSSVTSTPTMRTINNITTHYYHSEIQVTILLCSHRHRLPVPWDNLNNKIILKS